MYRKMLVLLDGSKLSEVVFSYAQELSGKLGIDLELLHVCRPHEAELLPMREAYMERMAEILQDRSDLIRSKTEGKLGKSGSTVRGTVVVGYPAEEILKYVDANGIDVLMLATHGSSGIKLWDLGSVAEKVIHASKIPVWLVPSQLREEIIYDHLPNRRIVVPLNGSAMAEKVIPHAVNLAKQRGAESELVFIYVHSMIGPTTNPADILRNEKTKVEMNDYLKVVTKKVCDEGVAGRSEVLLGDPAAAIIDFVKSNPAHLIAMATHGGAGLSRMIFGSVTENIVHLIKKTPIFLVKSSE